MNRLLLVVVGLLAAYLYWQIRQPSAPPVIPAAAPADGGETNAGAGSDIIEVAPVPAGIDDYAAVVERPLFVESRRPPSVRTPAPAAAPAPAPPEELQLTAVAISEEGNFALIRSKQANKTYRLAEGAELKGWVLDEVKADGVTLRKEGEVKSLPLLREAGPVPPQQRNQVEGLLEHLRSRMQSRDAQDGGPGDEDAPPPDLPPGFEPADGGNAPAPDRGVDPDDELGNDEETVEQAAAG